MITLPIKKYFIINGKKVPFIGGGKGGCFPAGTEIFTPRGYKNIEDIRVGDEVYAFNAVGTIVTDRVTQVHLHEPQIVIKVTLWNGQSFKVTPNHWFLTEDNEFKAIGDFRIDEVVVMKSGAFQSIIAIDEVEELYSTYNITVEKNHTYIAESVRVHNKGGGKGGNEVENDLFSTDVLFLLIALGEGPVYRVLPNGPQDIEINEASIDDLINLDTDGLVNSTIFNYSTATGTITQDPLPLFGEDTVSPQLLSSAVYLKKGNIPGIPRAAITLQPTSANDWDALRFSFNLESLLVVDTQGNIYGNTVEVKVTVYDHLGLTVIGTATRLIEGKTNTPYGFQLQVNIPVAAKDELGYKFTVEKLSDDSESSKTQDAVVFQGWDEISKDDAAYPRTALVGYALVAFAEHQGSIPTFSQMIKGLLCKVPSNYNQPILEDGEIDWRQLELPEAGTFGYTTNGYYLQKTGAAVQTDANPIIYQGLWDGSFVFSWTQNPVWIIYDLLTNRSYGLGIPEKNLDKYKFYRVAQYCDGVDSRTGAWYGVDGYADGSFRHKPRGQFSEIRETLLGINEGIAIKERRFTCDLSINAQEQVIDIINRITSAFRALLYYSGGKITLNADLPDEVPVAIFNEGNIIKDSLTISGIKEDEIITGVEVAYIEPSNHFRREVLRVDDPDALRDLNEIENITQIDLVGCTRRSQAIRFAQYLIASSKYIRRNINFQTTSEAINLTIGDVISVSQRSTGTAWGYGGRIASNSSIGNGLVTLEHFTSPAMTASTFSSNTLPLVLRVLRLKDDRVDLYLLNTNTTANASGNAHQGIDLVTVDVAERYNQQTKVWSSANSDIWFKSNNVPSKGDMWTLGEVEPSNVYTSQGEKLFKINNIEIEPDQRITISAGEYISNVYTDSDTLINYSPVQYKDTFSPLIAPPPPILDLYSYPVRNPDGSISYNISISATTDTSGYPLAMETEFQYAAPDVSLEIEGIA